jgi:hypothetical protein
MLRLYKNKETGLIYQDTSYKETILSKYKEKDYILLFKIILYLTDDSKKSMQLNMDEENALNVFSRKYRDYIKINNIKLSDFDSITIKGKNFKEYMEKIEIKPDVLKKLTKYTQATAGNISENILILANIEDTKINIKELFNEISSQFIEDNPSIVDRSDDDYELWRNKIIKDTVRYFNYSKLNKDIFSFILLHIFKIAKDYIDILNLEELFDGKKKKKKRSKSKKKSKS